MKRVVNMEPALCIISLRSAKSSTMVNIWGRGLVLCSSFNVLMRRRCRSRMPSSAPSSHSLWKELCGRACVNCRTASQALSISTLGLKTWTSSKHFA